MARFKRDGGVGQCVGVANGGLSRQEAASSCRRNVVKVSGTWDKGMGKDSGAYSVDCHTVVTRTPA
jgi:hypothetical protein